MFEEYMNIEAAFFDWVNNHNTVIRQSIRSASPVRIRGMGSVQRRVSPAWRGMSPTVQDPAAQ